MTFSDASNQSSSETNERFLFAPNAKAETPILWSPVDNWAAFHVNAVRKRFVALDAPPIGMAGANLGFAFSTLANYRRLGL
jgi:hypothetical protein